MTKPDSRWVLAFDGSCATCRQISEAVDRACEGRLEVLPLAHADVRGWRALALGSAAEWEPTLLRVDGERVRVWTGPAMAVPLVRRVGSRGTLRTIRALGELKRRAAGRPGELPVDKPTKGISMGRAQFLRLGAGLGVAAGLVLAGKAPAFADQEKQTAQAWAHTNRATLPQAYDDVISYSEAYRKAIFVESSPQVRSQLWVEQLDRYRAAHRGLTAQQRGVLNKAAALARDHTTFDFESGDRTHIDSQLSQLSSAAAAAFGSDGAYGIIAALGPSAKPVAASAVIAASPNCGCSTKSDWCIGHPQNRCDWSNCHQVGGCGSFWHYTCDGFCS